MSVAMASEQLSLRRARSQLRRQAAAMGRDEARFLVDAYYTMQKQRIRLGNQVAAGDRDVDTPPQRILGYFCGQFGDLETLAESLLEAYARAQPVGRWSLSILGIGPIISAGLLAHIDIARAPTVGHIWRLASLDPTEQRLSREQADELCAEVLGPGKGQVSDTDLARVATAINVKLEHYLARFRERDRETGQWKPQPHTRENAAKAAARRSSNLGLKVLAWKIGESFVKQQNKEKDIYGHVFAAHKALEQERNEAGQFAAQAAGILARKRIGKSTEAYKHYAAGRLPDAHIHARAKRYAVKLFLAHWHHVAYEVHHGTPPPRPYVVEHLGHAHFLGPPNWPMAPE